MALRHDYVMRMVRQLADALAAITGLRRAGRTDEALVALTELQRTLLGELDALVGRVDPASAAQLLGQPHLVLAYARLLAERGEILLNMEETAAAAQASLRAMEMALEAAAMRAGTDPAVSQVVEQVRARVDPLSLSARHRSLLERVTGARH